MRLYQLTIKAPSRNLPPRYRNVLTECDGDHDFVRMRWELVPSWWPKPVKELKAATFNARVETVADKPFFGMPSDEAASSLHRDATSGRIPRPAMLISIGCRGRYAVSRRQVVRLAEADRQTDRHDHQRAS